MYHGPNLQIRKVLFRTCRTFGWACYTYGTSYLLILPRLLFLNVCRVAQAQQPPQAWPKLDYRGTFLLSISTRLAAQYLSLTFLTYKAWIPSGIQSLTIPKVSMRTLQSDNCGKSDS